MIGPTGICFIEAALQANHRLTIYARNPSKLPESISKHQSVTIIKGELSDEAQLQKAAKSGATVLVSFLGPTGIRTGTVCSPLLPRANQDFTCCFTGHQCLDVPLISSTPDSLLRIV